MSEYPSYLIHYGIQGQKWGVRRFQNEDGTYTELGKKRRGLSEYYDTKTEKFTKKGDSYVYHKPVNDFLKERKKAEKDYDKAFKKYDKKNNEKTRKKMIEKGQELAALEKIADDKRLFEKYIGNIGDYKDGIKSFKLAEYQSIMKMKLSNLYDKNDTEKAGFFVDKDGYAEKTKNGINYMFDSKSDSDKKLGIYKDLENKMPKIKNDLDKKVNEIIKKDLNDWNVPSKHNIKLQNVYIYGDDTAEANYWDDGPNDPLGGHEISVEFDIKTGKYRTHSLNG